MAELIEAKEGEQYPLLKTDSGGGDGNTSLLQPPLNDVASVCNITRTPKRSWIDRWPEFFSACWIAFILFCFGISFLAFFTLGVNVFRRQPLLITKHNASKQASTVFYHHIIPGGSYVPFMVYSNYISSVATQYPLLNINVIFLLDDSSQNARHIKLFKKLAQPSHIAHDSIFDQNNKREIRNVQKKYPNVNITIMPLSKYMALTPHRYKWRQIPIDFLSFYVRIFAVWQNGGIAMDLTTYNNIFNMHRHPDRAVSAILKQHNDGIENEKYINVLKRINQEEQNELFTMFYLIINHVLNETSSFFNRSLRPSNGLLGSNVSIETPLLQSKRNKRHNRDKVDGNETDLYAIALRTATTENIKILNYTENLTSHGNHTNQSVPNQSERNNLKSNTGQNINSFSTEKASIILLNGTNQSNSDLTNVVNTSSVPGESYPKGYFFYDVSIMSDNFLLRPDPINLPRHHDNLEPLATIYENFNTVDHHLGMSPVLTISSDGSFVAAPSKHHPLLAYLVDCGFQGVSPTFTVNRALMTQCTGLFKNEMYCDNIYVL